MAHRRNKVKEEGAQEPVVDISKLSISELAKQIENQTVDPNVLDKAVLEKCAVFYKSRRGYKKEDIAEILQVCSRTVERYIKNVQLKTSLKIGANFQNELLGEVLNNLRLRYDRLWRLSYSDNLSDYEKARIIFMCDQIEMNEVVLLGRLGYLSREQGLDAIKNVKEEMKEVGRKSSESIKKQLSLLTSQQWQRASDVFKTRSEETENIVLKMVADYLAENERQKKLNGHVADFTKLHCNVFVIKGLQQ